jgi:hypothetical protein
MTFVTDIVETDSSSRLRYGQEGGTFFSMWGSAFHEEHNKYVKSKGSVLGNRTKDCIVGVTFSDTLLTACELK